MTQPDTPPPGPSTDPIDDSWMPDAFPAPDQPAPKARGKVTSLRPLEALGARLNNPPVVGGPDAPGRDQAPPYAPGDLDPPEGAPEPVPGKGRLSARPRPFGEIWQGCPVKALGVNGKVQYLLDIHGQLRPETKIDLQTIKTLFGNRQHLLHHQYPAYAKGSHTPTAGRFDQDKCSTDVIAACADCGIFDPQGAVRGVGAWVDDDGQLIYHLGDRLLIAGAEITTQAHQGKIYPAYSPIPHPIMTGKVTDPVPDIMEALETWAWERPEIDAMLALGMLGCQMLGGALEWRPQFWVTGGAGAGKSLLHTLISLLHGGDKGQIKAENATSASIANFLRMSTLPVMLDELEATDEGSPKEKAIVELIRIASSGGRRLRSDAAQGVSETIIRSTFMASSILIPGVLQAQDLQRIIVLSLQKVGDGAVPPNLRAETWRKRGAALKRLLIDRWPTWAQRLEMWREAFAVHGISGRDAANWATTIAMADMAEAAELPSEDKLAGWTAKLARHFKALSKEGQSDDDEVLTHLLSQQFDPFRRGERFTVAIWLKAAAGRPGAGNRLFGEASLDHLDDQARRANVSLASIGLRVVGTREVPVLFVATQKVQGLKDVFIGSKWAGGAWSQSLLRAPGAKPSAASRYLQGVQTRGTDVPFSAMPGLMALDGDEVRSAAPSPRFAPDDQGDYI